MRQLSYLLVSIFTILLCSCGEANKVETQQGKTVISDAQLDDHKELFARAKKYYAEGTYDRALADVELALTMDTFNIEYTHLRADIKLNYYRSKDALGALRQLIRHRPDHIPTKLKLVEYLIILKQNEEAVATINEILRDDPQNSDAYFLLGLIFREERDETRAVNSLLRAVELDADQTDAWIILGNIYEENQEPIAKKYYENAVNSDGENIIALHSLAFYAQNNDDIPKAIELYDRIIGITPDYQDAHLNRAIILMQIDSFEQALAGFEQFSQALPESAIPHYYQGYIHELAQKADLARSKYEKAISLDPNYQKAKDGLGRLAQ